MPKTKVVVDTNALIRSLDSVVSNYDIIVPICVMEELDNNKSDSAIGYNCREAIRYIEDNNIEIDIDNNLSEFMIQKGWIVKNDNLIIACAFDRQLPLVTGDTTIYSKARALGMEVIKTSTDVRRDGAYTGFKEIYVTDSDEEKQVLSDYYSGNGNPLNLYTNEYLIVNKYNGSYDVLRYDGSKLVNISVPTERRGKKNAEPLIKPKNPHQLCAIDLLNNPNIPIKIIAGTYGSGKTWLATKMALHHLNTNGIYSKFMVVRNPVGSGEEIGFLPGTKEEKIADFFKPIEQQLKGGEFELKSLIQQGKILFEIPFYMKGMSLGNGSDDPREENVGGYYVMVDEAEDLDLKTLKLIGTRLGKGSCIVFSGDYKQAERPFQRDNGLIQAIEKLKGNPLVGIVVLQEDVRSEASKVFAELE